MDDEAVPDPVDHERAISPIPREARPFQGQRAGIVTRLIAATLDCLVVGAIMLGSYLGLVATVFFLDPRTFSWPEPRAVFTLTAALGVAIAYLTILWTLSGRTYGYLVMGLRVLGFGGRRLRFPGALARAAFVVFVPIGIFLVPLSRHNKSLQDLVLGTRVVYDWEPRRPRSAPSPLDPDPTALDEVSTPLDRREELS